jgi:hypothetical protein
MHSQSMTRFLLSPELTNSAIADAWNETLTNESRSLADNENLIMFFQIAGFPLILFAFSSNLLVFCIFSSKQSLDDLEARYFIQAQALVDCLFQLETTRKWLHSVSGEDVAAFDNFTCAGFMFSFYFASYLSVWVILRGDHKAPLTYIHMVLRMYVSHRKPVVVECHIFNEHRHSMSSSYIDS